MGKIKRTTGGSVFTGRLPEGCRKCLRGEKLVLFVTGVCKDNCYYCPVGFSRRGKDRAFANERRVVHVDDLMLEAKRMKATGAGITGGDPLLKVGRTVRFVRALKRKFGKKFHIHLYTSGTAATRGKLKRLYEAGVDEIRFHRNLKAVKMATKFRWEVGGEIPAMPGKLNTIKKFLKGLEAAGATFCNINELEFSEGNMTAFLK